MSNNIRPPPPRSPMAAGPPTPSTTSIVIPSRNALRVLRNLALAGSTLGSFCAIAAITYDVHRRLSVAERIVQRKRALQTSAPNYDAAVAAGRVARMMEAAEKGEFTDLKAFAERERKESKMKMDREREREVETERFAFGSGGELGPDSEVKKDNGSTLGHYRGRREDVEQDVEQDVVAGGGSNSDEVGKRSSTSQTVTPATLATWWSVDNAPKPNRTTSGQSLKWASSFLTQASTPPNQIQTTSTDTPTGTAAPSTDDAASPSHLTIVQTIRQLIDAGRSIEAAQVFLDTHPSHIKGLSVDRRELAVELFYINCKEENVFIARSIYSRLEEIDMVSEKLFRMLIIALAKRRCTESVATLYMQNRHKGPIPPDILDIVIRSLLESRRLTSAKWLLFQNLKHDHECGLAGAYLHGLWKKTRSIELVSGQHRKLLTMLPRIGKWPTEKLFNPVLHAYVEFGKFAEAEAMVTEMRERYNLPLSGRTKGFLVIAKALQCDWQAVERGLDEMHDLGFTKKSRAFAKTFDRIFLEYWVVHPGAAIWDFLQRSINKYNLVPDQVLYKHIVDALIAKGTAEMISNFRTMGEERQWRARIDTEEFKEMVRAARFARDRAPSGVWQLLQAARMTYSQAATSQLIMGFDRQSVPLDEANKMPYDGEYVAWYERTLQEKTPSRPADKYQRLDKQMLHYIQAGKMAEAIKCFNYAKRVPLQLKLLHVELALIATLLEHGVAAAKTLVEMEWRTLRNEVPFVPIFFQQVTEFEPESEAEVYKTAVFRFYQLVWNDTSILMKHHITVATSRRLIQENKADVALDLLSAVYMSRYGRVREFTGTEMKMFVRAFAQQDNLRGVRWCLLTALSRNSALSKDFVVEVRRLLPTLGETVTTTTDFAEAHPTPSRATKLQYLTRLADLLERKCNRDVALAQLKVKPHRKTHIRRTRVKRPQGETATWSVSAIDYSKTLRTLVNAWDEEMEFEVLFDRVDSKSPQVQKMWSEYEVRSQLGMEDGPTLHLVVSDDAADVGGVPGLESGGK